MPLEELTLRLDDSPLPTEIDSLIDEATKRSTAFYDEGLGKRYSRYVPSDPVTVYRAIDLLIREKSLRGRTFCEWGSGFATAACIAATLGLKAYGIELVEDLVQRSRKLAADHQLDVTILEIDYLPEGFEDCEGVGGKDLVIPSGHNAHDGIPPHPEYDGLDPSEVDLFYVFPWPGEEKLMMDLFEAVATEGAILLIYLGDGELAAFLHDGTYED